MQVIEFEHYNPEKHGAARSKRGQWQRVILAAAENGPVAVKANQKSGSAALYNAAKALGFRISTRYTEQGYIVVEVVGPVDAKEKAS